MLKRLTLLAAFTLLVVALQAQTVLRGGINDADTGEPLIGANLLVVGTSDGAVTDFDGQFELRTKQEFPFKLEVSYLGYTTQVIDVVNEAQLNLTLAEDIETIGTVEITGQRIGEKQKASPRTVEQLDAIAIKQTAASSFYDGLGALKGVDMTSASLGFKVINTRGFNSTSPVRSLQIIDGVDNQAPGLNFSLGNFLGSSELDVQSVDIIVGANSALYGPNAFNGVISITTKDPFYQQGLSGMVKVAERNLLNTAVRFADVIDNKDEQPMIGYKLNFEYLRADDWVADNFDPVFDTKTDRTNPGGYDAVNIYGDEYRSAFDDSASQPWLRPGLNQFHGTGYREQDLVNYDTRNLKAAAAVHVRLNPEQDFESPTLIAAANFSNGTTVYQGDNRFSLQGISFFQSRLELRKRDKYFVRAYYTVDDAGESFDPYFTALRLQQAAKSDRNWALDYRRYWTQEVEPQIDNPEDAMYPLVGVYPDLEIIIIDGMFTASFDQAAADSWLAMNNGSLMRYHADAAARANSDTDNGNAFYEPGTDRFQVLFDSITGNLNNFEEMGTRFFDKSALYHAQGEYTFNPEGVDYIKVGGNTRLYTPNSRGTVFVDTMGREIRNFEFGIYTGIERKFYDERITASATFRMDKNENFDAVFSPAASIVYKPKPNNYARVSFSSAVRNPTLADQYLLLNVGRATLAGNLDGVENLVTVESFEDFLDMPSTRRSELDSFNIAPIQPEKVRTVELGYRTTIANRLFLDASYYYSEYRDFLGFNIGVRVAFDEATGNLSNARAFRYAANSLNKVTTQGFSIGANYYFWDKYQFAANYSFNKLNDELDDPIIPAFNTPTNKYNIGVSGRDIEIGSIERVGFNVNYKWVEGFLFEGSPQFTGFVPEYGLLDAQINYTLKNPNLTFKLGASNLLNNEHFEAYGGPRIGRLAYFSIVYESQQ